MALVTIENTEVAMWKTAIRGMRNPKNSWDRMDSDFSDPEHPILGPNDLKLAKTLISGGPVHRKFLRMITVGCDIIGPAYWVPEFDTYKVGTVRDSCSFMHKGVAKPFEMSDFLIENLDGAETESLSRVIDELNWARGMYLQTNDMKWFRYIRQILPHAYKIKFTWTANYEILMNIYQWRHNHRLAEWHDFCHWIEGLPYMMEFLQAAKLTPSVEEEEEKKKEN